MIKRVVVAGCRNYDDYEEAKEFIDFCISRIRDVYTLIFVSGGCHGADFLGECYAVENGFEVEKIPAEWERYGKSAGPRRNKIMSKIGDYFICFWDGNSKGTKSMIDFVNMENKPLKIKYIKTAGY